MIDKQTFDLINKVRTDEISDSEKLSGKSPALGSALRQQNYWINVVMRFFHHDFSSAAPAINYYNHSSLMDKLVALSELQDSNQVMPRMSASQLNLLRKKSSALLSG